jgi:hypothetical protein
LIILSFISFLPQLRLLVQRRTSSGISLYYVLFNLISATEQFTISFLFTVTQSEESDVFVETPPNTGDWLNLVQFTVVWILWLAMYVCLPQEMFFRKGGSARAVKANRSKIHRFALCLYFPSDRYNAPRRSTVIAIYISFLLISVVPVFVAAIQDHPDEPYGKWLPAMIHGFHSMFLNPVITLICFAALLAQWRTLRGGMVHTALSPLGLILQAIIFAIAAATWPWRLRFFHDLPGGISFSYLGTWYSLVGWVAINNGIFALAQIILFWVMARHGHSMAAQAGETSPLLGQ